MKHSLRYCFVLLALATTGLFAQTATAPVTPAPAGHHKSVKLAKKGKKAKHKKHKKHHKHKRHHHGKSHQAPS